MKRLCLSALFLALILSGCAENKAERQIYIMDTVVDIAVTGNESEAVVDTVEKMLGNVDALCSPTDEESEINRLNRAGNGGMAVSQELEKILQKSIEINSETGGAFDITLGKIIDLWNIGGNAAVPEKDDIDKALESCGSDKIKLSDGYASVVGGSIVNLGGIAKGYAAERAIDIFEKSDIFGAILSIGGNVCVWGKKNDGTPWKVGLRDPKGTSSDYIGVLEMNNQIISVSGDYERFFEIDGRRYHHIMDGASGRPAESDISSVSVICEDGLRADALSTALYVMGKNNAIDFWKNNPDFELIIIGKDNTVTATEGISDNLRITDGRYSLETASR